MPNNEELPVGYGPRIIGTFIFLGFVALTLAAIFTFVPGTLSLTAAFAMSMVAVGCSFAIFFAKIYYDTAYKRKADWTSYYRNNQHSSLALGIGSIILAVATIIAIIYLTGGLSALGTHGIPGVSSSVIKVMSGIQTAIEFAGSVLALGALLYTGIITITDRKKALTGYEPVPQKDNYASISAHFFLQPANSLAISETTNPSNQPVSSSTNNPSPF